MLTLDAQPKAHPAGQAAAADAQAAKQEGSKTERFLKYCFNQTIVWLASCTLDSLCFSLKRNMQARQRLLTRKQPSRKVWRHPDWHGLTILTRNPLFLKLTLVLMLNGIVSEGLWEIMTQYLQLRLGFNTLDNVRPLEPLVVIATSCCMVDANCEERFTAVAPLFGVEKPPGPGQSSSRQLGKRQC